MRARTFGQCIDAVRALDVEWNDGPVAGRDRRDHPAPSCGRRSCRCRRCRANPLARPSSGDFTFYFRSNSAMDTNSAIADVRADRRHDLGRA